MNPAHRFLGLDISSSAGYAVVQDSRFIKSGVWDLSLGLGEHRGHRYIRFYNGLVSLGRIDQIFYEEIMFTDGKVDPDTGKIVRTTNDGRENFLGLKAIMNMYAAMFDVPIQGIWPGTLKKAFAGSGRAEKNDMCRAARELGWKGGINGTAMFHDEADAIGVVAVKMRELYGITPRF